MKKLIALVLAVMLLVPAFAMADNVIRIGVFEPSTGDNGAGGKQEILGIEYANSLAPTVTIGGEEYTVELVIEDNQSLTDKAISAAQSLVSKDVSVVLGSYGSGVSMAGGDVFAEAGVPAIGVSCTNPNVTLLCDYYWAWAWASTLWKPSRAWAAKWLKKTSPKAPATLRLTSTTLFPTAATWCSLPARPPMRP